MLSAMNEGVFCRELFIEYPIARTLIDYCLSLVFEADPYRPQGCLIVSKAENGKSSILRQIAKGVANREANPESSPGSELDAGPSRLRAVSGRTRHQPFLYLQATCEANRRGFYRKILQILKKPLKARTSIPDLIADVIEALRIAQVRVLLIDELHHALRGRGAGRWTFLDELKYISNEVGLPLIAAGTDEALNAIKLDAQYMTRFRPVVIPTWKADRNFASLLASLEIAFGLPRGRLNEKATRQELYAQSEGRIGRVIVLVRRIGSELADHAGRDGADTMRNFGPAFRLPFYPIPFEPS